MDNQTERRYQPAFIQLLISEGWSVLHNSRHSPLEFGKDVIARDPNGVLHCFQLKGNPGTRVTKGEAQDLLPQVRELLELPAAAFYRNDPDERHVAVFVTNGTIDEEAMVLLELAAERTRNPLCAAHRFEVVARGHLLARLVKVAGAVWPTSIEGTREIPNLMAEDGQSVPDPKRIGEVLGAAAPTPGEEVSKPGRAAHLGSLLMIAEIIKAPWYASANHYALFVLTVLASVHALRVADTAQRREAVQAYAALALEHVQDLLTEARDRGYEPDKVWGGLDVLGEFDIQWERGRLIGDAAAALLLSGQVLSNVDTEWAQRLTLFPFQQPAFWGQAGLPAYLLRYWAVAGFDRSDAPTQLLAMTLNVLVQAALGEGGHKPLPGPYYDFETVWAFKRGIPNLGDEAIYEDSFARRIQFARAMLQILARRGAKAACQAIWPDYSKLIHEEPLLPAERFFDARLVLGSGVLGAATFHQKAWDDLFRESNDPKDGTLLEPFAPLAWLIAAYVAIVPYRAWTGVLMWLDRAFEPAGLVTPQDDVDGAASEEP